ncbi:MAG: thiamine phosphate synthase [Candidatus Aminicenantes bacterium]|nr:thiamine phosphate synthase [Candidatus Aminicenantes bacterium]
MKPTDWKLCLIADLEATGKRNLLSAVQEAASSGVTLVQLRTKALCTREFLDLALQASEILKTQGIPLIINDRVDIALSCDATGVHLGKKDLPLPFARKLLGPQKIIGATAHSLREAQEAEELGADYLGVGPVFLSPSKKDLKTALGLQGLIAIREKISIPILAIGGINPENAHDVMATGVNGVAVISAILGAKDIEKATKKLLYSIEGKK